MFRCCTILAGFVFAFAALGEIEIAQAQSIQVRFSPVSKNSSVKPIEFLYHIRTDKISSAARNEQLTKEMQRYGSILDKNKCIRKQGPATEQDCVGFVTERLFWGGKLSSRNRNAELRGPGANNFYLKFMKQFCQQINGESARRKGDIVAFLNPQPDGSKRCMHIAIVTENGKILSKDSDGSVFLISGGNDSLNVPFKGYHFEYWRLKDKLRAEMLYDFRFVDKAKDKTQSVLIGWQPIDPKQIIGRYHLPKQYTQLLDKKADLGVLTFVGTQNGDHYAVNDKKFTAQVQRVIKAIIKMSSDNEDSADELTIDQFTLSIRGAREKWNVEGKTAVTITTLVNNMKKKTQQNSSFRGVATPHEK